MLNAPDDGCRIQPLRTALSAFDRDPTASGQKPQLHVLAKGGLGEAETPSREKIDNLIRSETFAVLALDATQLVVGKHLGPLLSGSLGFPRGLERSNFSDSAHCL